MRVMFVDDDTQVLNGITRMLDCADVDWDVETATSGAAALEILTETSVDVVVTDMQMPGMDGAELLDEVSRLYPAIVRIVLSGQANKQAVYRAVASMHQYLAKPCAADVLRDTISRAFTARKTLDSTKSREFLGRISSLPSFPTLYQKVVAEIESETGTVARVGEIIAQDPAMTAKLLQLANSAIFSLRSVVSSPVQAASLIGLDTLKSLILTLQVFKSFDGIPISGFSIDALLTHSLRVGTIARMIAHSEALGKEQSSEAFTAGLLHDVGKLILAANAPEDFQSALVASSEQGVSLIEAERTVFGTGHDHIGGHLLALWGIPQCIVEAVIFHHSPAHCGGSRLSIPALVCIANLLAHEETGTVDDEQKQLCEQLLVELGVPDRLNDWRRVIRIGKE